MNGLSERQLTAGESPGAFDKGWVLTFGAAVVTGFILFLPVVTLICVAVTLAVQAVLVALGLASSVIARKQGIFHIRQRVGKERKTVLSIQIPAHNEPPEVLLATLAALCRQVGAFDHEVLVVINNTDDAALWHPIKVWCDTMGPPFRFLRRDKVIGAKSGALNIAFDEMRLDATHIVVIDADYQVVPNFLRIVTQEIAKTDADFIQFPQAYRHLTSRSDGLSFELADYFSRHARAANVASAMLLTGTLSVIRREALVAAGGWPLHSCTEDADLGSRMIAVGRAGVFVDKIVGRGLMPLNIAGLHSQRHRWAAGNARVLQTTVVRWLMNRAQGSSFNQKVLIASQLSAWLNLGIIAAVLLGISLIQNALFRELDTMTSWSIAVSSATVILIFASSGFPLMLRGEKRTSMRVRCDAFRARISMLPVSAIATVCSIVQRPQSFRVTPKRPSGVAQAQWTATLTWTALTGIVIIGMGLALEQGTAVAAGGVLLLSPCCALWTRSTLNIYAATVETKE